MTIRRLQYPETRLAYADSTRKRHPSVGGRLALVTSGYQGPGSVIARSLALDGCHVILTDRNIDRVRERAELINEMAVCVGSTGRCVAVASNLSTVAASGCCRSGCRPSSVQSICR